MTDLEHRVSPKDDVFVSSTVQETVIQPVVVELQREAQREATSQSFDIEPAVIKTSTTVVPAEITITAKREDFEISTSDKFTPERVNGLALEELIQTVTEIPVVEEPVTELRQREIVTDLDHRVSPKDDVFVSSTVQETVIQPVVVELQREAQREATSQSFDIEPAVIKTSTTVVPAEITITAKREDFEISTSDKFTPERVNGLALEELIQTVTEIPVVEEPVTELRQREIVTDLDHRVSPKDDVFVSSTVQETVIQPVVVEQELQREAQREATSESFDIEPAVIKTSTTVVPAEITITAKREDFEISTSDKFTPERVNGLALEELIQTVTEIPVVEEPVTELRQREIVTDLDHRVSPKDDVFVSSTVQETVIEPVVVEQELQREAQREATSESFDIEPAVIKTSTTVVPAEITITAKREDFEISTSDKFTPERVNGLALEELIQTVTEIPVVEEPVTELRQREIVTDLEHRVSPKDDVFVSSTVQETVIQPVVVELQREAQREATSESFDIEPAVIKTSTTVVPAEITITAKREDFEISTSDKFTPERVNGLALEELIQTVTEIPVVEEPVTELRQREIVTDLDHRVSPKDDVFVSSTVQETVIQPVVVEQELQREAQREATSESFDIEPAVIKTSTTVVPAEITITAKREDFEISTSDKFTPERVNGLALEELIQTVTEIPVVEEPVTELRQREIVADLEHRVSPKDDVFVSSTVQETVIQPVVVELQREAQREATSESFDIEPAVIKTSTTVVPAEITITAKREDFEISTSDKFTPERVNGLALEELIQTVTEIPVVEEPVTELRQREIVTDLDHRVSPKDDVFVSSTVQETVIEPVVVEQELQREAQREATSESFDIEPAVIKTSTTVVPAEITITAKREDFEISTSDKFTPERVNGLALEELIQTVTEIPVVEEPVTELRQREIVTDLDHRVSPKDDVFVSSTVQETVIQPVVVEQELQREAQREATSESFDIEPAVIKTSTTVVPAEITITAKREDFEISTSDKFTPERVNGLALEELIQTVTEIPVVEEPVTELRQREIVADLEHRVSPKDDVFVSSTVQETVIQPVVVELQREAQREATSESFDIEPAVIKTSTTVVPAEITITAKREDFEISTSDKFTPERVNGLALEELIQTVTEIPVVEEPVTELRQREIVTDLDHRVSPKDDVFVSSTVQETVIQPVVVEQELQREAQREATSESFDIEPAVIKTSTTVVPAEITITAKREDFEISTSDKFTPERVDGLALEELIQTVTEIPVVEEPVTELRQREIVADLEHRVSPKDDVFVSSTVQETVIQPVVVELQREAQREATSESFDIEPAVIKTSTTVVPAEITITAQREDSEIFVSSITTAILPARPSVQFETIDESTGQYII